jgi:hypothetical protein
MKTLEQILNQEPVYLNDFTNREDVIGEFSGYNYNWNEEFTEKINKEFENVNILFASYGCANYSGDAFVLFEEDGELYEVNGGHCSCYGLEDQWNPDLVMLEELEHRLVNGSFGEDNWSDNNFKEELCKFLGVEFKKNINNDW